MNKNNFYHYFSTLYSKELARLPLPTLGRSPCSLLHHSTQWERGGTFCYFAYQYVAGHFDLSSVCRHCRLRRMDQWGIHFFYRQLGCLFSLHPGILAKLPSLRFDFFFKNSLFSLKLTVKMKATAKQLLASFSKISLATPGSDGKSNCL